MRLILFLTVAFLLISCKNEKFLEPSKNIEFKNSLGDNYRFIGSFKEKDSIIIFFADLVTKKKVYFHTKNGKLIDSITFNNSELLKDDYYTLSFINRDTLFIGNNFNIIALNKNCDVIKKIERNKLLKDEPFNYHFHFSNNMHGEQLKDKFYVNLGWRGDNNMSVEKFNEIYEESTFSNPNLLCINDFFTDNCTYTMYPKNYYTYLFENPEYYVESLKMSFVNNNYIISTDFSNKIIIVNDNFKTVKIEPDSPSSFKEPTLTNMKYHNGATFLRLFYSETTNSYMAIYRHSLDDKSFKFHYYRPFSIIQLDNSFNKITEKAIFDNSHEPYYSFAVDNTIFVKQKNTENENKNIFSTFNF